MSRRKGREGSRRSEKVAKDDVDEVETLLQAAEDELLLNLSIDSHVSARGSLDPDLLRRFQALRSKPLPRQLPEDPSRSADAVGRPEEDECDLFARFAALKDNNNNNNNNNNKVLSSSLGIIGKSDESDDDEDEVAKVMRWAVDAARLDPYDDDDDDDEDEVEMSSCSTSDDDDDNDDDERGKVPKKTKKIAK